MGSDLSRRARPGARGQRRGPPARRHRPPPAATSASSPRSGSRRDCAELVEWWRRCARRSPPAATWWWLDEPHQRHAAVARRGGGRGGRRGIRSGWVAQGPRVAAFERPSRPRSRPSTRWPPRSCTTALHLALVVAGVGAGDDVVVPSFSFIATANAPTYVGARPVFCRRRRGDRQPHRRDRRGRAHRRGPGRSSWSTRAVCRSTSTPIRAAVRPARDRGRRGRRLRRRVDLPRPPGRRRRGDRGLVVPPAQAAHHR